VTLLVEGSSNKSGHAPAGAEKVDTSQAVGDEPDLMPMHMAGQAAA
jgi:hypothetical protein